MGYSSSVASGIKGETCCGRLNANDQWVIKETQRRQAKLESGKAILIPHDVVRETILKRCHSQN